MADPLLESRLEFLLKSQNPDGGWGYLAGQHSWVEPTVYALLALHSYPPGSGADARGWRWLKSWQRPDGSWSPAPRVDRAHWTTALCVTLHSVRHVDDAGFYQALRWLVDTEGAEATWWKRLLHLLQPKTIGHDPALAGWPWLPGTGSWVEPTCHTLIAIRKAVIAVSYEDLKLKLLSRLRLGEQMMLARRAADGGWNYGNRLVLGHGLPSYPETTALGLLALMGAEKFEASEALATVSQQCGNTHSRLARAWLGICLRAYDRQVPEHWTPPDGPMREVHIAALEALAAPEGNFGLLQTGAIS